MYYKLNLFLIIINICLAEYDKNFLIISLSSNSKNIKTIHKVIYSILEQKVDNHLYKILLILPKNIFYKKFKLPIILLFLANLNKIRILLIKKKLNLQTRLILAMKEYQKNPILIISDFIIYPEGWLKMFINDHRKYPNDVISASIQYYFGKNLNISEFSEGYKGKNFGIFNHISNMVFNFALINSNFGGTLFPPYSFRNKHFFNLNFFLNVSKESDVFWQSCFIIIENKVLRQSSKIFDFSEYLIDDQSYFEKKEILEKIKDRFIIHFPDFTKFVEMRQKKIIVSFTSYYKRFGFLTNVIQSIKQQTFLPEKILLILYENDYWKYNLNLTGIEIIKVNKDIKPHKKYFYTMIKYRDYAIITLDDDIFYPSDTISSIYESYIKHPNIISGRRSHLINFKKNLEIDEYLKWTLQQNEIKNPDYNLFITTGAGAIYPPDILNIEERYLNLINEVITTDDIILKHFEINKGIEAIWVPNELMLGMEIQNITSEVINIPLFNSNILINDININKLNIDISNIIIKNCCIQYKNIQTGSTIYLFNIDNIMAKKNEKTTFTIDAYSYCPINAELKFQIIFNNYISYCFFNNSFSIVKKNSIRYKTKKIIRAFCSINKYIINFNDYYFPFSNISYIKINNKRKYLTIIFKDFYCIKKNCILTSLFYKNRKKGYEINAKIYKKRYLCTLNNTVIYLNNKIPVIENFTCVRANFSGNIINEYLLGGIPTKKIISNTNNIPNQFFISKIIIDRERSRIVIKGKLFEDLLKNITDLIIYVVYPKLYLTCYLNNSSKHVQSNIYCYLRKKIDSLLIENQIIYNKDFSESLLLINHITLYQNYEIEGINRNNFDIDTKADYNFYFHYIILIIVLILLKYYINFKLIYS